MSLIAYDGQIELDEDDWADDYDPDDDDGLPPEAFMTGICGGTKMYACECGGDLCVCGIETIICEGCIDCIA